MSGDEIGDPRRELRISRVRVSCIQGPPGFTVTLMSRDRPIKVGDVLADPGAALRVTCTPDSPPSGDAEIDLGLEDPVSAVEETGGDAW